jgi:hypothetical protein
MVGNYKEDSIVIIFDAIPNALDAQCEKQDICQGVDYLSDVYGNIVVLYNKWPFTKK